MPCVIQNDEYAVWPPQRDDSAFILQQVRRFKNARVSSRSSCESLVAMQGRYCSSGAFAECCHTVAAL